MIKTNFEGIFFMDIETVGAYADLPTCEKENPAMAKLFIKNLKWLDGKYPDDAGKGADHMFKNRAALIPEFAKVVAVAYAVVNDKGELINQCLYDHNEKNLLSKLNTVLNRVHDKGLVLCGHSIKSFDIPFLAKRMIVNGMAPHKSFPKPETKPWEVTAIDTKEIWQYGTYIGLSTLESVCVSLGIESPKSDELYGASVHKVYWEDNKLEEISEYCKGDVFVLTEIVKKLQNLN